LPGILLTCVVAFGGTLVTASPARAAGTLAPPGPPVISYLTAIGATVSWAPSSSPGISDYMLLSLVNGEWTFVALSGLPPSTLTSTPVALQPATTYTFAVVAEGPNGERSPRGEAVTFATPPRDTVLSCQVEYTAYVWTGGFYSIVRIVNTSSFIINGWTLRYSYAGDQQITPGSVFNGVATQAGHDVAITNNPWTVVVGAFGQVNVGFTGTDTTTFTKPSAFTLNDIPCSVL
jgi:mannan endo-1,4-beta-mannosidase